MKKVLFIVVLIAAALCIFHECENNQWGGPTIANAKDISGPYSIERQWRVFRSDNLLIQAYMYFPDNTTQTMSIAVYRICEFWDDCDAQILVNDIDVTDKVCDIGTDVAKVCEVGTEAECRAETIRVSKMPLPKEIVLKQLKLIERFYGYVGDLDSAPPAIRSFIKLVAYKRLCYAYDGKEAEDRFTPSYDRDSEDNDQDSGDGSQESVEAVTEPTVSDEVTDSTISTPETNPTQAKDSEVESLQVEVPVTDSTHLDSESNPEENALPVTTTTSEGEIVQTVP